MAGRSNGRSRPARKQQLKRNKNDDEESNETDEETNQNFYRKKTTKRKRTAICPNHCLDLDKLGPCPYSLVVNGTPASKGQFPYQVALHFSRTNGDFARGGGTIISNKWILTAAHLCKDARKAVVLAGAFPSQNDAEQIGEADLIIMQDAYLKDNMFSKFIVHDIALLRLKEPLKSTDQVKTICLPSNSDLKNDFAGQVAILSGWGKTGDTDEKPFKGQSTLNFAHEKILSNQEAAKMLQVDELPSTLITAIGTDGKARSCNGDSGGPLVLKGAKGNLIVVGIVSHRIGNCGGPLPHMLTRVTSYVNWISRITQSTLKDKKQ